MIPLETLGERIMVLGPSNAGKSTLALALSSHLSLPIVHLDQLQHLPDTDWEPRAEADFKALHDGAVQSDRWIMDGNYSRLMPGRIERATGIILITSNRWLRLARYLKRTLINPSARAGHLEGGKERVKWEMIEWILFKTPHNHRRYAKMISTVQVPKIECRTATELNKLYENWGLDKPK